MIEANEGGQGAPNFSVTYLTGLFGLVNNREQFAADVLHGYQWVLLLSGHSARHTAQILEVKAPVRGIQKAWRRASTGSSRRGVFRCEDE
jgi:hypothetical protein